jgi:hypothetical protein
VTAGFATLAEALLHGAKLMDAVAAATDADAAFDLTSSLGQLFGLNLVSGVFHD